MKHQNVLRILVLVLAIAMMLVVASCNGGGDKSTTPEQTSVTTPKPTTPEVTTPDNPPEHVHTEEVIPGKEATCSATGLTEGKVCSECGETLVEQEVIEKLPHTEEVVAGKDATCSATGLTEGKVCSVCGDTIVAQETIEKLPHTEEVIPGKAASCTETGLTEGKVCSVCGDTIVAQETIPVTDHTYVDGVCSVCGTPDPGAPVYCDEHVYQSFEHGKWGICTICSYVDDNHEHIIEAGKCLYCDFEIEEVEVPSVFDNDGDGVNDVYLFAAALPERFRQEGVVAVDAWVENLSDKHSAWDETKDYTVQGKTPYRHVYCTKGAGDYLLYNVTVEAAGTYEMAIHLRLKDNVTRGGTFVINEGTVNEQVFSTSYGWATTDEAMDVRNNDKLIGTYMFGIKVELQAGVNTIKITESSEAKTQHYRDFFFLLVEKAPVIQCEEHVYQSFEYGKWGICTICDYVDDNHEHIIEAGKCLYCDFEIEEVEVPSVFDNDGDGVNDVYLFAAALPEKFRAEGVVAVDAWVENLSDKHSAWDETKDYTVQGKTPYRHVYCTKGAGDYLLYNVTVEKAGIYEMAIHIRLKDNVTRGGTFIINEGTENEQVFSTSYGWATTDDAMDVRNNDKLIGSYMYGIMVELQAGVNTIKITESSEAKTQHYRDFFFLLVEEAPETVTVDKAIEIGMSYEKGKYSDEYYYVTLTLDNQVNENGFARMTVSEGLYITVAGGYLAGDDLGAIKLGDTVTFLAKLGAANSAMTTGGKELRLYEIQSWKIVTPEA